MHILLTNDDGPPHPGSSPYILPFARVLAAAPFSHRVSVVIPSQQRSWIGKAHLLPPSLYPAAAQHASGGAVGGPSSNEQLSDTVAPSWYDPATGAVTTTPPLSSSADEADSGPAAWVLIPGTPATCTQLGLFHHSSLFSSGAVATAPPIDLVISGPNYGRNTTAAFALSSGTLGGALEAAVCGVRAVAVSFAYERGRPVTGGVVDEACTHAARVVQRLCEGWAVAAQGDGDEDVPELFSVNVPLVEGVSRGVVRWTWMLGNKWRGGSLYKVVGGAGADAGSAGKGAVETATTTRDVAEGRAAGHIEEQGAAAEERQLDNRLAFRWQPTFADIWATIESSGAGNDGLAVKNHETSVTPLRANFAGLYGRAGFEGELKL